MFFKNWMLVGFLAIIPMTQLFATTCVHPDYDPGLCDLPEVPGSRCVQEFNFRYICATGVQGCEVIPGGCIGSISWGHWFALLDRQDKPSARCKCGCFSSSTRFGKLGQLTGTDIIARKTETLSMDTKESHDNTETSLREINGIMHSEDKSAFYITTDSGKSIILSEAHPVLVAGKDGILNRMEQAKNLKTGDLLLSDDGTTDPVASVELKEIPNVMMNFNVISSDPAHHVVIANGLQMGDHAWQEILSSRESRIMYRNDILTYLAKKKGE